MPKKKEKNEDYVYSSDEDDEPEQRMSSPAKLKRELIKCSLEKRILEHKLEIKNLKKKLKKGTNESIYKKVVKKTKKVEEEYMYNPITNKMIQKNITNRKRIKKQTDSFLNRYNEDILCRMLKKYL